MLKVTEHEGVYIVQLRPETRLELTLLRDIEKAAKGMSEQEYWDVKPKVQKDFMDEGFVIDKDSINPFTEEKEISGEYVQDEIEWSD